MRRAWLLALLVIPLAIPTPAAPGEQPTVTFRGRFVCDDRGVQTPLADMRVELWGAPQESEVLGVVYDLPEGQRAGQAYAGPDGEWSFQVPFATTPGHRMNYAPALFLDDGDGTTVTVHPTTSPVAIAGDTNQADREVQDYRTLAFNDASCTVWLGLRRALAEYTALMGKRPPYGTLTADYGAPTDGHPYTEYTTIMWPRGVRAGADPDTYTTVKHEFAHTIRNAALGRAGFVAEMSGHPYKSSPEPCRKSDEEFAFTEGWAEWYAGDFDPAPNCPGASSNSLNVEGIVAWRLTELERGCAAVNRQRMIEVMLAKGRRIYTFDDFAKALGTCQGVPFDAGSVPRVGIAPGVSRRRAVGDLRDQLQTERQRASSIASQLTDARRAAQHVHCVRPPCTLQLARKMAPAALRGGVAQARLISAQLASEISRRGQRRFHSDLTRRSLAGTLSTPTRLTRRVAAIGARSLGQALRAGAPIARRDHSAGSTALVRLTRSRRAAFARAKRHGVFLPLSSLLQPKRRTRLISLATHLLITFDGIPEGTVITIQAAGVTFGDVGALGFPGPPPRHTCPAGPTASGGLAVAPDCDAGGGLRDSGLVAKLASPAQSVRVIVGTTQASPGGFAADLQGYDTAGNLITSNAALVGATSQGQGSGPAAPIDIQSPNTPIAWIALYLDASFPPGPHLLLDNLEYDAP